MTSKRGPRELVLLHLSDIHLRKEEIESAQDLDEDIRERLLADIAHAELPVGTNIDAILVTGDIAFGAKNVEYDSARKWLQTLCGKTGCPASQVWVVPGNHDVDRDVHTKNATVRDMHAAIRNDEDPAGALSDRLREEVGAQALMSHFVEYNKFAEQYGCESTPAAVFWESDDDDDDLTLNDGSHLRLRGINSAIISDKVGDKGPPKGPPTEVIGAKQVQLRDEVEGVAYVTLCHHPPDWLRDGDVVQDYLISRARIQLFGHKHRQRARVTENSLIVGAGALHPNRKEEGWQPRYNILRLEVHGEPPERRLWIDIYQRVWKPTDTSFGKEVDADGRYPKRFDLKLGPWSPSAPKPDESPSPGSPPADAETKADQSMISIRDLVFRLFALSYPDRMQIIVNLKLLDEADNGVPDGELVRRAIGRAKRRGLLAQLEGAIRAATPKE